MTSAEFCFSDKIKRLHETQWVYNGSQWEDKKHSQLHTWSSSNLTSLIHRVFTVGLSLFNMGIIASQNHLSIMQE